MHGAPTSSPYRGRRALVLGTTGFIGRWVASRLAEAEADLHLAARDEAAGRMIIHRYGRGGRLHVRDLAAPGGVEDLIADTRPDVVFNLAGYGVDRSETDEDLARAVNDHLVRRVVSALDENPADEWTGARLVHTGSALEYGVSDGDLAEDSTPRPTTLYGRTKLAGTEHVVAGRERGIAGLTARLFTVYGAGEHAGRLLPTLLDAARRGEPVPLSDGLQQRDFGYVEDVADALLELGAAADRLPADGVVNVATGVLTSVRDFASRAGSVLGIAEERLRFGAVGVRTDEMQHQPVNVGRIREILGAPLPDRIEEGVARTRARLDEADDDG